VVLTMATECVNIDDKIRERGVCGVCERWSSMILKLLGVREGDSPPLSVLLNIPTIGIRVRFLQKQSNYWKVDPYGTHGQPGKNFQKQLSIL
jgi:hypothetical protein